MYLYVFIGIDVFLLGSVSIINDTKKVVVGPDVRFHDLFI